MKRLGVLIIVVGTVLAALLGAPHAPTVLAGQSGIATATPAAVTFEPLAGGVVPPLVAAEAGVRMERARFAPGGSYVVPADDAVLLLVAVESGALTVRSSVPLVVDRAAQPGAAGGTGRELVAAGNEVVLGPGDAFVRPPGSEQELRNDGQEPAVALAASVDHGLGGAGGAEATPTSVRGGAGLVVALAVVVVPQCPAGYDPAEIHPAATPGGGGGGGGGGGVAMAVAAAPECVGPGTGGGSALSATPTPSPSG